MVAWAWVDRGCVCDFRICYKKKRTVSEMDIDTMDRMQDYYSQNYQMFFSFEDKPDKVTVTMIDMVTNKSKTETTTDAAILNSQSKRDDYMMKIAEKLGRKIWEERNSRI